MRFTAARAALQRKKQHETALTQTNAQMMTVEREIFSIEAANINKETFDAMNGAKVAMKNIHGNLNIDKVDQTMEELREQHDIGEQIAQALTAGNDMQGIDMDDLDEELAQLQQEELDEKMLKTGSVPVSDRIHSLPSAANGPGKSALAQLKSLIALRREISCDVLRSSLLTSFSFFDTVKAKPQAQQQEDDEEEELRKLQAEMAM
jgi:charged multivesicular body protein 4